MSTRYRYFGCLYSAKLPCYRYRYWSGGWVDWNAALDYTGGPNHINRSDISAPILVDATTNSLYVQASCVWHLCPSIV